MQVATRELDSWRCVMEHFVAPNDGVISNNRSKNSAQLQESTYSWTIYQVSTIIYE